MPIPSEKQLRDSLADRLLPTLIELCPAYGLDPSEALEEAIALTRSGRYAYANNFWLIEGAGDEGFYTSFVPYYTESIVDGGISAQRTRLARFRNVESAVRAYCEKRRH